MEGGGGGCHAISYIQSHLRLTEFDRVGTLMQGPVYPGTGLRVAHPRDEGKWLPDSGLSWPFPETAPTTEIRWVVVQTQIGGNGIAAECLSLVQHVRR